MDMTEAYTDKPVQEQVGTSVLAYDVTFCIIFITNLKKFFRVWSCMYRIYPCISRPFTASKSVQKIALDLYMGQKPRSEKV